MPNLDQWDDEDEDSRGIVSISSLVSSSVEYALPLIVVMLLLLEFYERRLGTCFSEALVVDTS